MDKLINECDLYTCQLKSQFKSLKSDDCALETPLRRRDVLSGLRGVPMLFWEHSIVTDNGLVLRDKHTTLGDLKNYSMEGILWLFLTGKASQDLGDLKEELGKLATDADNDSWIYTRVIDSLSCDTPVITQLCSALLALHGSKSIQGRRLRSSLSTKELWKDTLQDVLYIFVVIPKIAGYIIMKKYGLGDSLCTSSRGHYSFAGEVTRHLLGSVSGRAFDRHAEEFISLYLILHADHGGGNASAHTCRLVGSTLADPFQTLASALASLSGPLHGGANGEALKWFKKLQRNVQKSSTGSVSTAAIRQYTQKELDLGLKIPGFGHAALKKIDPRVVAMLNFADSDTKLCHHRDVAFLREALSEVSAVLRQQGKVRSPHPNVDAVSGVLLSTLSDREGLSECNDALVADLGLLLFSLGRSVGLLAHLVLDRALGVPLERPDSVTLGHLLMRSKL